MYIAIRTDDGRNTGKISFYCNTLQVSRQAFYDYLERKGKPWKYQPLADAMLKIHDEDEENADYGRVRMYQALKYRKEVGKLYVSAIFDCYDLMPNGLAMADHMRAELCCETLKMQACGILIFAEQLYIPIGAASIQVLRTELLSKNMALSRA